MSSGNSLPTFREEVYKLADLTISYLRWQYEGSEEAEQPPTEEEAVDKVIELLKLCHKALGRVV